MASIHPSAIVDPKAQLADSVSVGPYAVIGPQVRVGEGTSIGTHCVIEGRTTIGRDNRIPVQLDRRDAARHVARWRGDRTRDR